MYELATILSIIAAAALLVIRFRIASLTKKLVASLPFTIAFDREGNFILREHGQVASRLKVARHDIEGMKIAGFSGVATEPEFRGKGYASVLLEAALGQAKSEMRSDFAVVFAPPELEAFYAKRGWTRARIGTATQLIPMCKKLGTRRWPDTDLQMGPW